MSDSSESSRVAHEEKVHVYGEVVKKLNTSREGGLPFQPGMSFKEAYESLGAKVTHGQSVNMQTIWQLVQAMSGENSRGVSKRMSLAIGARFHLQHRHEMHIVDTILSQPPQVSLSGGNLEVIRAFLRIRLTDFGDFNPPADTTWEQIYFCLRTGYYEEATELLGPLLQLNNLHHWWLTEWITKDGMVAAETAALASEECEKMLRTGDRLGTTAYDKKKLLLYTIISGSRRQIESILRDLSTLFNTIEDLVWFKLACVRDVTTGGSSSVVLNGGLAPYSLDDLQAYLNKFEPSYYTKNGEDPLVYPYVLLLSVQLLPAILHLSKEGGDGGYNIDAVHIAITLVDHSVLSEGSGNGHKLSVMDANAEASSMIRQYGSMFLHRGDLQMTVEYYAQAAYTVAGGQLAWSERSNADQQRQINLMLKQLLIEILMREGGMYFLLGARGSGEQGQLVRFFSSYGLRYQFLMDAVHQCQKAGLHDKSVEIKNRMGSFSAMLETISKSLSEALARVSLDGEIQTEELMLARNDILQTCNHCPEVSLLEKEQVVEQDTILIELEAILLIHKLARQGNYLEALRGIAKLPYLHLNPSVADATADVFQSASPYFQACVPHLFKVALTCLDNVPDTDEWIHAMRSKIAGFLASNTHQKWPCDLYEKARKMSNSSVFSSIFEAKIQEQQSEALLLEFANLKKDLVKLEIRSEKLHGQSCKHLSLTELTSLQSELRQGLTIVEKERVMKELDKEEDDKLAEKENKDSYERHWLLADKRRRVGLIAKIRRRFCTQVQREVEPVEMKKKIKYMKRKMKGLELWNERMLGNKLDGMGYYELKALESEVMRGLVYVQKRKLASRAREKAGLAPSRPREVEPIKVNGLGLGDTMIACCAKLRMSQQEIKAAKEAVLKCEELNTCGELVVRSRSMSVIAVVLYLITQLSDDKKAVKDILKATGVAQVSIKNSYEELCPHFPKIAPSWYAKEEDLQNLSSP